MNESSLPERWCPRCWYDLRGTPVSVEAVPQVCCPECGWRGALGEVLTPKVIRRRKRDAQGALLWTLVILPLGFVCTFLVMLALAWLLDSQAGAGLLYFGTPAGWSLWISLYAVVSRRARQRCRIDRRKRMSIMALLCWLATCVAVVLPLTGCVLAVVAYGGAWFVAIADAADLARKTRRPRQPD